MSKVIYDHLKKKIRSLGLGSNIVERYIEYLPDNLYFIWKFGKNGYDMHSTESRAFIQQTIVKIGMKKMIDQQIKSLNTYNITVKFGFNNDDENYGCDYLALPPNKQMFEVKEFMVNIMNKKMAKYVVLMIFILKSMVRNFMMKGNVYQTLSLGI